MGEAQNDYGMVILTPSGLGSKQSLFEWEISGLVLEKP